MIDVTALGEILIDFTPCGKSEAGQRVFEQNPDGALVCTKEGSVVVPGFKAEMVDTTGAGDSFWGGFLNCLLESEKKPSEISLEEVVDFAKYGNAVAGLCVEKRGAIPAMPTIEEIKERLDQ